MTTSYRDRTADLLRAIALFLLFAAHTSFPDSFQNIREFDVPLLFFLSGMSYVYSIQGSRPDQKTYLLRRFRKLILRVWIFLIIFFLFFNGILHSGISSNVILNSFLMTGSGIMFVWVYRVFFFNCITLPILQERTRKMPAEKRILIGIAALAVNDLIYRFLISPMQNYVFQKLLTYLFSDTVGFTVLAWFGASYPDLDEKGRIRFTLLFLVFYLIAGGLSGFPFLESMKYPPSLYFSSYGMFCSSLLYLLLKLTPVVIPSERDDSVPGNLFYNLARERQVFLKIILGPDIVTEHVFRQVPHILLYKDKGDPLIIECCAQMHPVLSCVRDIHRVMLSTSLGLVPEIIFYLLNSLPISLRVIIHVFEQELLVHQIKSMVRDREFVLAVMRTVQDEEKIVVVTEFTLRSDREKGVISFCAQW